MLKTEANVAHDYRHFCETLALGRAETFLGVAPFYHAYGAIGFLAAFYGGGRVSVLPRFLPAPVLTAARRDRATVFLTTPPMIEILGTCRLEQREETAFESLKFCICSTGHLKKAAHDAFQSRFGIPVKVQYGSTETLSATIDLEDEFKEGRVGRPYAGVEIGIFGADGRPSPAGAHGIVGIRSPAASDSYVGDMESTARTFHNDYVFPGDRGYLDDAGRLYVLGRSDVINIGGEKVDRLEVETVIRKALPVRDVVVVGAERGGITIVRALVEADPERVTKAKVVEVCRERLSPHKIPGHVEVVERFDRDANGKILRAFFDE